MAIYFYLRVSTPRQSLERQRVACRSLYPEDQYPDVKIIEEVYTGTTGSRPEWSKLLKRVKFGDTIVFDSVSRMSRNAEDGINTYFVLYNKGVNLVFVKERHIDTASYDEALKGLAKACNSESIDTGDDSSNKLVRAIMDALREFQSDELKKNICRAFQASEEEVKQLRERTSGALKVIRAREDAGERPADKKRIGRQPGAVIETKKAKRSKQKILEVNRSFGSGNLSDADTITLLQISRPTFYKYKKELTDEINHIERTAGVEQGS